MLILTEPGEVCDKCAGHMTSWLKPATRDRDIGAIVDNYNPSVPSVISHVRHGNDYEDCNPALEHAYVLDELCSFRKAVTVANLRHTIRWEGRGLESSLCRGDFAFPGNDKHVESWLVQWGLARKNGTPRDTDDLDDYELLELLRFVANDYHLGKSSGDAFAGIEESPDEPDLGHHLDSVNHEGDEALDMDPKAIADEEAELIDAISLPENTLAKRVSTQLGTVAKKG